MQSITVHFRRMGRPLLALVALALIFESAPITRQAHAQPTPNDQRILQRIQPSGYRALRAANLNKAASEDVVVLDQRWMYEWNGSDFWQVAQTVYVYQGTTRTEEWQFVWNGQAMLNQSRTRYQVQSGRTLVELQEGFDPVAGEFYDMDRYTYEYTYDLFTGEPNHLHRMTHETKIDGVWRALERTTYEQPSGTRVTGVMDEWAGEEWRPIERFTMREEVAGVIQEVEERTGNEWTFTRRTTFPGYTIESLRETTDAFMKEFLDYAGLNIAAHLFPNYIAEDWNGFEWIPTERKVSLLMDPDVGNGLSFSGFVYESYVNDSWIPEQRLVRTHRMSDNRTIESTMALFTGANWTTALRETYEYLDSGALKSATQQVDTGGGLQNTLRFTFHWKAASVGIGDDETPEGYALDPAYPNPFNPATTVQYRLSAAGRVSIRVFDMLGRHVATLFEGSHAAGTHEIAFDASGLSSGIYLIRMDAPDFSQIRTVTLLK